MNSLYYKEEGEGPVLVLLHGFCETHEIWKEIIPELSIHFKIIAPDLPGFGKSNPLTHSFSIQEVAQTLIDLLAAIGISKCVLIGHSLGGYVALSVSEKRPDLIEGLCLFHSTALPDSEEKKMNRGRVMDFVVKNGVQPFIETFVPSLFFIKHPKNIEFTHKIASKTSKNTLLGYTKAMRDRLDMTGFLLIFPKPILFLAGENDNFIGVSSLVDQAGICVNGKIKVLPETGHMGMFEATAGSIKIVKDFAEACFHITAS